MPTNHPQELIRSQDAPADIDIQETWDYDPDTDAYVITGYQIGLPNSRVTIAEAQDIANFILNRTGGTEIAF